MAYFLIVGRYVLLFALLGAAIAAARVPTLLNICLASGALATYLVAEPLLNRRRNRRLAELLSEDRHRFQVLLSAFPGDGGAIESSERHLTNNENTAIDRRWFSVVDHYTKRLNNPSDEFSNQRLEELRKAFINHCIRYVSFLRESMQPIGSAGTHMDFPESVKTQPRALEALAFQMRGLAKDVTESYRRLVSATRRKLHF